MSYRFYFMDSYLFDEDGYFVSHKTNGKQVYHQKHLFVDVNYEGFNLDQSKKRTKVIKSLPEIRDTNGIKSKIGSLKFWNEFRNRHNLPAYMNDEENEDIFMEPYTLHGIALKSLPQMNKFVEEQEFDLFSKIRNTMEEMEMIRELVYRQTNTKNLSIANRIMSKIIVTNQNMYFNMFLTLYKPWDGKPYPQSEAFITLDDKFLVKRFNSKWYCLPIIHINDIGIITTKVPDEFSWEDRPKAYDTQLECMLGHFMERMRMFNLTPEQDDWFKKN